MSDSLRKEALERRFLASAAHRTGISFQSLLLMFIYCHIHDVLAIDAFRMARFQSLGLHICYIIIILGTVRSYLPEFYYHQIDCSRSPEEEIWC